MSPSSSGMRRQRVLVMRMLAIMAALLTGWLIFTWMQADYAVEDKPMLEEDTADLVDGAIPMFPVAKNAEPKKHLILFWTAVMFFLACIFSFSWFQLFGASPSLTLSDCPIRDSCEITVDRSRLADADAVIFHMSDFKPDDLPSVMPALDVHLLLIIMFQSRSPSQRFVSHHGGAVVDRLAAV